MEESRDQMGCPLTTFVVALRFLMFPNGEKPSDGGCIWSGAKGHAWKCPLIGSVGLAI
jgi:hypothetical protein